jgi:hypothetical protein
MKCHVAASTRAWAMVFVGSPRDMPSLTLHTLIRDRTECGAPAQPCVKLGCCFQLMKCCCKALPRRCRQSCGE